MHAVIILILVAFLPVDAAENDDQMCGLIEVISRFFAHQKEGTNVVAFLCWKDEHVVKLKQSVNDLGMMISTSFDFTQGNKLLPTFHPGEHQFFLIDAKCGYSKTILNTAYKTRLLLPPYRWLILTDCQNPMPDLSVHLNSRIYVLNSCDYKIRAAYKHPVNDSMVFNDVTAWNGNTFTYYNRISDVRNRSDLMGTQMNVSFVLRFKESINHLTDFRDIERDALSKHNYILALHVGEVLNATCNMIARNSWGYPDNRTGLFNGMCGDIQQKTSEIGATPTYVTKERLAFSDFIHETTIAIGRFIFRAPPLSSVSNVFYLPFTHLVWLACIALLFIIFSVVYAIIKWEWSSEIFQNELDPLKFGVLRPRFVDVIQLEIGGVCQQGAEAEPKSTSGRIATFFIFFTLMFLYVSWSANIVALLQSTSDNINTLQELYDSNMELAAENVSYLVVFFKFVKDPLQVLVNARLSPPNKPEKFIKAEDGVAGIRNGYFAFFAEIDMIYKIISKTFYESEKCALREVVFWTKSNPLVIYRKNSTYKELIKTAYAKINEGGLRKRNLQRLYTKKPTCANPGANFASVSINDCYFAAVAFSIGIALSLIIFTLELFGGRNRNREITDIRQLINSNQT